MVVNCVAPLGGPFGRGVRFALIAALAALVLSAAAARAAGPRILALGDSITAGYGLPPGEALPDKLQARLTADGFEADIVNAGVSGDTTAGGLARLDWALGDEPPAYALVELGANDALRGLDPAEAYDNLDKILARLQRAGVKALLIGMRAPANWGRDYRAAIRRDLSGARGEMARAALSFPPRRRGARPEAQSGRRAASQRRRASR